MRAVFGVHDEERLARFGGLIETFSERVSAVLAFPMLRRNLGPWSPWSRFLRARKALDEFIYEEIALRRSAIEAGEGGHDDVLSLLLEARHDDGSPMSDEEPFGGGVRRCIGAAFAEYEMRIILREIIERAELSAPDPKPEKVKVRNITLAPGRGTWVRLDRPLR